jgi:3-oxoacyl-[acyl-carrier-protein] synthase III
MWRATASETFRRAAKSPRTVDSVVGVTSPVDANQLLGSLHDIGVGRALILGLAFQQCSGTAAALRLAADLIAGGRRDVLVVQCGRCLPDERIDRRRRLVFSDAAASCVVSSEDGELEILSSESATDPGLAAAHDLAEYGQRDVMRAARLLRGVLDDAMKSAGVTMPEVRAVFCATGNTDSLIFMSEAAGLPKDAVHRSGLARHGHVLGCDGLIGLVDYADEQPLSVGDCLLLYSWSSCVVGATVLRYRGSARTV